ncbi:replicative DNA helicase [bacterium]|jgi:replicative DNA helicase|nr:replicative DNA helicase [bacterium]MBT4435557.1 replicative DNA helicase [bacterium]|tara:strand:- start:3471 stop:4829 length:1359 start_codon:yes stop_codon:yes gene_type:complete
MQVNLKTLPQNKEAEQAVLGSILIDQNAMNLVLEEINEDDFYDENHKKIFSSMVDLEKENKPIDILTLYDKLKTKKSLLKEVGGSSYLSQLVEIVPSSTNVSFYAKSVKEKSVLRSMIKTASEIIVESQTDQVVVDEFVDEAEKKLFEISQNKKRSGFVSSAELAKETLKIIENLTTRKQAVTGVSSGFKKLDKMTSGFQNSDLIIIAARPGMGKTSFSLNILMHAALVHGLNVGFFSLEMAKEQLMMRMLSAKSKINFGKIRTGFLSDAEFQKTVDAATSLQRANIFIDDTPAINSLDLRSRTRRLQTDKGIDLLIVDYLQLMRGTGRTESREREIAEISLSLKALAKEMKIPIIAISQLSRQTEARTDKKPQLSDLRESGALEQDADMVMFLHRADAYKRNIEERDGLAEIIIGKQRNGPTGTVSLAFLDSQGVPSFENLAEEYGSENMN